MTKPFVVYTLMFAAACRIYRLFSQRCAPALQAVGDNRLNISMKLLYFNAFIKKI